MKDQLKAFAKDLLQIEKLLSAGRQYYKTQLYIQTRIVGKLGSKYGKVEVMINYWDKLYGQVMTRASQLKDK